MKLFVSCSYLTFSISLRASSPIWASEVSLARTRERGAETFSLPLAASPLARAFSRGLASFYGIYVSIMNRYILKSYTNKKTVDRPRYIQSGGSCSANYYYIKYKGVLQYIYFVMVYS